MFCATTKIHPSMEKAINSLLLEGRIIQQKVCSQYLFSTLTKLNSFFYIDKHPFAN